MKNSAVKIQTWWRAKMLGKNTRSAYLMTRKRIVLLQSVVRQFIAQKCYKSKKLSAMIIQKNARMFLARKEFCKKKASASKIQIWWKARIIGKEARTSYLSFRKNFILAQALIRGWITRREYRIKKSSAIVIQKCVRRQIAQRKFCFLKDNTIKIQRWWKNLLISRSVRQKYIKYQQSSVKIQSVYRMYHARNYYQKLKKAVEFVELCWSGKKQRKAFLHNKKSVVKIQASYRAYRCKKHFTALKSSAVIIQTAFRRHKHQKYYSKLKQSTIIIQGYYRQYRKMCSDRERYLKMRTGFSKLQAVHRGAVVRRQIQNRHNKAVIVQSWVKMLILRHRYLKLKKASIVIQQRYLAKRKMNNELQKYQNLKTATILIQSHFRKYQAYMQYKKVKTATIKVQSFARMLILRKRYYSARRLIIKVQQIYRAKRLMTAQRLDYVNKKKAAIILQSRMRGYMARKNFEKIKNACIVIQSAFRSWKQRSFYLKLKAAAISVQNRFRALQTGRAAGLNFLHFRKACVKIQSYVRMVKQKKNYNNMCASAVLIQNRYRSLCVARNERQRFLKIKKSCIVIQSFIRMSLARRHFIKQKLAAIKIQSHVRSMLVRKGYLKLKKSVQVIECHYSALKVARKEYSAFQLKKECCIKIQAWWQRCLTIKQKKKETSAAITIQKMFRKYKLYQAKLNLNCSNGFTPYQQRQWYMNLRKSLIEFQRSARRFIAKRERAAIVIQSFFRRCLIRKKEKREKAALKIQALWRGYSVRRDITDKLLLKIRKNIGANSDEYHWLSSRTNRAVNTLLHNDNIRRILSALKTLDTCTRLSSICCVRLEQSGGLSQLINLINNCNRSVPHREILTFCLNILLNVAKYDKTVSSVWKQKNIVETAVTLMRVWIKDGDIFSKCCCLLYIFCQEPWRAEVLKNCSDFTSQIEGMKRHMRQSKSTKAPRKSTLNLDARESVRIDPEWLLGNHRKRAFKDPDVAISSLMQSLGLETDNYNFRK